MIDLVILLGVFLGSITVGYWLIVRVPPLLHTPLMSMTNAISAVTLLGALLIFSVETGVRDLLLGGVAITMAAFNLVGGFAITGRMLKLFRQRETDR